MYDAELASMQTEQERKEQVIAKWVVILMMVVQAGLMGSSAFLAVLHFIEGNIGEGFMFLFWIAFNGVFLAVNAHTLDSMRRYGR